jgi:hypothetical protein
MPVLKTYTATIGPAPAAGGRRASAEDFGAGAGLAGAGKAVQDSGEKILDNKEQEESRKALITSTELRAKYARELDEAALSGGDTAALKEKMAADFARVGETFSTKRGVEAANYYAANSELMYDEQANRIEVQRAAANARLQGSKFLNDAAAVIRSNPNALAGAEADADALVSTFPKLRPDERLAITAELKQQLSMSAALAAGRVNPEQAIKDLEGGRWNLKPGDRETAVNQAENEIRARRTEAAVLRADAERQKNERDNLARDRHFKALFDGAFSARAVMDDPDLSPQTREHLIVFAEQRAKALTTQEKASDPIAVRDLWMRIHAPETDERRIYNGNAIFEAVSAGKINTADANQLNILVANQKDENNRTIGSKLTGLMNTVQRALSADPRFGAQPALVAEIQNDYQARVWDKVSEYRASGKNPSDLFIPGSKDSVVSREFIQASIDGVTGRANAKAEQDIPVITTQDQYDKLAPGTVFRNEMGTVLTKPEAAASAPAVQGRASFEPPGVGEAVGTAVGGVVRRLQEATPRKDRSPVSRRPELPPGDN